MIDTLWIFWRRNVLKNSNRIIATTHPYLSGVLAVWLTGFSGLKIKPFVLAGYFIPYDTVVFGFTATAVALSIALPSERFIKFLSEIRDGTTPFKDFLFILAWNGVVHILAFFLFIPIIFLGDGQEFASSAGEVGRLQVFMCFVLWMQFYAAFQFLVTTIGIYELADLYATYCAKLRKQDDGGQGPKQE